jgi:hypothetical protein
MSLFSSFEHFPHVSIHTRNTIFVVKYRFGICRGRKYFFFIFSFVRRLPETSRDSNRPKCLRFLFKKAILVHFTHLLVRFSSRWDPEKNPPFFCLRCQRLPKMPVERYFCRQKPYSDFKHLQNHLCAARS